MSNRQLHSSSFTWRCAAPRAAPVCSRPSCAACRWLSRKLAFWLPDDIHQNVQANLQLGKLGIVFLWIFNLTRPCTGEFTSWIQSQCQWGGISNRDQERIAEVLKLLLDGRFKGAQVNHLMNFLGKKPNVVKVICASAQPHEIISVIEPHREPLMWEFGKGQ